jgi:hypothetical protein
VSYTFSVTHDTGGTIPLYHDLMSSCTYAGFDQRHALSINYVWALPGSHWNNKIVKALLDNWQIGGTTFYGSGRPQTVTFTTTDSATSRAAATAAAPDGAGLRPQSVLQASVLRAGSRRSVSSGCPKAMKASGRRSGCRARLAPI